VGLTFPLQGRRSYRKMQGNHESDFYMGTQNTIIPKSQYQYRSKNSSLYSPIDFYFFLIITAVIRILPTLFGPAYVNC